MELALKPSLGRPSTFMKSVDNDPGPLTAIVGPLPPPPAVQVALTEIELASLVVKEGREIVLGGRADLACSDCSLRQVTR
jgi:hypothetical protein